MVIHFVLQIIFGSDLICFYSFYQSIGGSIVLLTAIMPQNHTNITNETVRFSKSVFNEFYGKLLVDRSSEPR